MSLTICKRCGRAVLLLNSVSHRNAVYLIDVEAADNGYLQVDLMLGTFARLARPGRRRDLHVFHADTCGNHVDMNNVRSKNMNIMDGGQTNNGDTSTEEA